MSDELLQLKDITFGYDERGERGMFTCRLTFVVNGEEYFSTIELVENALRTPSTIAKALGDLSGDMLRRARDYQANRPARGDIARVKGTTAEREIEEVDAEAGTVRFVGDSEDRPWADCEFAD